MSRNVVIDNRSEPLVQALQLGFSENLGWTSFDMLPYGPLQQKPPYGPDGIWPAGAPDGLYAPQRLFLMPYCRGEAGSQFSMRLYGWREVNNPNGGPNVNVWIPFLLAELACVACNRQGPPTTAPPGVGPSRFIDTTESLCDFIGLAQGDVGLQGEIVSTGPGSDLIAFAIVELRGCRYFQFDFNQSDPVPMNCLFARA